MSRIQLARKPTPGSDPDSIVLRKRYDPRLGNPKLSGRVCHGRGEAYSAAILTTSESLDNVTACANHFNYSVIMQ